MPSKNPAQRFQEIITETDFVLDASRGLDFETFMANGLVRRAIERAYGIISEAAVKLDKDAELYAPTIPWQDIRGIGNRLRHEYGELDYETLWDILKYDLAPLRQACSARF
ncbi:MAG: DUF86 domain-containing protein [Aquisalinus sp.]|nr:DUF86 domain-containing protein [Aquisalinus sp.]